MNQLWLLTAVLLGSLGGTYVYLKFASKYGPYATPNFRSLHRTVIPRGAGLAVAWVTLFAYGFLYLDHVMTFPQLMTYVVGGGVVAVVGAADDRLDISARYRLPFQVIAATWVSYWLGGLAPLDLGFATIKLGVVGQVGLAAALIWFYNLYNFIDGIDGMASSATIYICAAMGGVLFSEGQYVLATILAVLAMSNFGFLAFNWPPAKVFLGDAGSSFISYVISAVLVESLWRHAGVLWTWLIAGGVYFADTTLTTTIRMLTVPGWYMPHRSHAYQNLARIWGDHRKVVLIVMGINVFWILPLLIVSLRYPSLAMAVTAVVYLPIAIVCLKYGPLYENK